MSSQISRRRPFKAVVAAAAAFLRQILFVCYSHWFYLYVDSANTSDDIHGRNQRSIVEPMKHYNKHQYHEGAANDNATKLFLLLLYAEV